MHDSHHVSRGELSLSQKVSRLGRRLQQPEWRRYGVLLGLGKVLGIAGVLFIMQFVTHTCFTHVLAQSATPPPIKAADIVNPVNTVWTLIAAFLVFGMQVGFTMLEAGFCRSRETVNVLMECIVDTCLCGILFYAIGFRLHVQPWQRLHRLPLVLPAGRARNLRDHRRRLPRRLDLPVRLRRYLLHHHLRRHDRPHRLRRRPALLASASPASSIPSSATGPGVRMASSPPWASPGYFLPNSRSKLP